jgi:hypothetical protein
MNEELLALQRVIQALHALTAILTDPGDTRIAAQCLSALTGIQNRMMSQQGAPAGAGPGGPPGMMPPGGPGGPGGPPPQLAALLGALAAARGGGGPPGPGGPM